MFGFIETPGRDFSQIMNRSESTLKSSGSVVVVLSTAAASLPKATNGVGSESMSIVSAIVVQLVEWRCGSVYVYSYC